MLAPSRRTGARAALAALALLGVLTLLRPAYSDVREWLQRHFSFLGGGKPEAFRDALDDPTAKLFAFFQPLGLLPIIAPAGETPGDVYKTTLGGFRSRQPTCFPKLAEVHGSANLPSMTEATESELNASLKAAIEDASLGEGGVKLRFERAGTLRFENVSFLSTGEAEAIKSFEATKTRPECAPLAPLLDPKMNPAGAEGLILGNVYSATADAKWKVSTEGSGQAKVSADDLVKIIKKAAERLLKRSIPVNIDIGVEVEGGRNSAREISLVSSQPLPVAYTPLFISVRHLAQVSKELKSVEILESVFVAERRSNPSMPKRELRNVMTKEASMDLPSVNAISTAMQTGPFTPFDPENPDHAAYIAAVDTLLALSLEVSET
ncbi:hypothetical protein RZS28_13055 [Methylocapsa polymorpha]|uniref:Uncharacterized protein n=1 Tax=Methylocapsa polymorpha TaxID=3080828 RepID=A0ABZ0HNJ0_9HYPH|nr:hypothetical protein RZS28_13055 [Methylocapsa sp. RX1]